MRWTCWSLALAGVIAATFLLQTHAQRPQRAGICDDPATDRMLQAIIDGDEAWVRRLLQSEKVKVNFIDRCGVSPLHRALCDSNRSGTGVVKALIEHGADLNLADVTGTTPLMFAAVVAPPEAVRLLLENGADPKALRPHDGSTALHAAAWSLADEQIIRLLLAAGADPEALDSDGHTPADAARQSDGAELARILEDAQQRVALRR